MVVFPVAGSIFRAAGAPLRRFGPEVWLLLAGASANRESGLFAACFSAAPDRDARPPPCRPAWSRAASWAIVTLIGASRAYGVPGATGILEVPEMPLHGLVKTSSSLTGRLQERVPIDQPLAAIDFAFLEQLEERPSTARAQTSSSVKRVRCQSQLQPICFNWPIDRVS